MRIARFTTGGDPRYAIVDGGELAVLTGDPLYMSVQPTGERVSLDRDDLRLLAPVIPRPKGFDGSCPLGPWIVPGLDVEDLQVTARVNGKVRQDGRTSDMLFDVAALVAFASEVFTLLPGDVILTGTPAGVGPIVHGEVVECEVEGIGVLRNPVVRRD